MSRLTFGLDDDFLERSCDEVDFIHVLKPSKVVNEVPSLVGVGWQQTEICQSDLELIELNLFSQLV